MNIFSFIPVSGTYTLQTGWKSVLIIPAGAITITNSASPAETITVSAPISFGDGNQLYEQLIITGTASLIINGSASASSHTAPGSAVWGAISGTPSNQTDLQNGTIQGVFTPANTAIVTGDSFKTAFQKAQGQIDASAGNFNGATAGQMLQYQLGAWTKTTLIKDIANTNAIDISNRNLFSATGKVVMNWSDNDFINLTNGNGLNFYSATAVWRMMVYVDPIEDIIFNTNNASLRFMRGGSPVFSYDDTNTLFYQTIYAGTANNTGLFLDRGTLGNRLGFFVGNGTTYTADEGYITSNNSGLHILTGPGLGKSFDFLDSGNFKVNNGFIGVGAAPDSELTVSKQTAISTPPTGTTVHFIGLDGNSLRVALDTHNNANAGGTAFIGRRTRGTAASPSATLSGDTIITVNGQGYGTTGYAANSTGLITIKANQDFTDAAMGTYVSVFTTPDASVTAAEALRVTGAGAVNAIQAGGVYQINSVTVLSSSSLTIPTVFGSASASGNLQLTSTSNGTKGFIYLGTNVGYDGIKGFLGIGTLTPAALLHLSGNISAASWTTSGIGLRIDAATYTNTTSSGTVASIYTNLIGAATYNSSSSTTYTDLFNIYIKAGIAGTSTTITNNYAVGIEGDISLLGGNRIIKASNGLTFALTSGQSYAVTLSGSTKYGISAGGNHTFLSTSQASGTTPFMTFTQSANTGGACPVMLITAGASTSQTTATEVIDINYNLSAVLKSIDGTIATQRTFLIQPRTYTPQTSVLTITTAVTFDVSSSIAGSGTTITNNYAIRSTGNINLLGNIVTDTTTGIKIATATGQKLGFWNATPVIQQTTGIAAGAFVANTSGTINDSATYGGYTIGQIAAALRLLGILA